LYAIFLAITAAISGIVILQVLGGLNDNEFLACSPDNPTIYCVHHEYRLYEQRVVTITGTLSSYSYHPSGDLREDVFEDPKRMHATTYLTVYIKDKGSDAIIASTLTTSGEIHEDIIKHVLSLKEGDTVKVTGRVASICTPGTTPYCQYAGKINIEEINELSTTTYVKAWEIPVVERAPWYLGQGLQEGLKLRYNYSSSSLTPSPGGPFYRDITIEFHRAGSNNSAMQLWESIISIRDIDSQIIENYDCIFDGASSLLNCIGTSMPKELKDELDASIFFLGRHATLENPQPLWPIMSRWPDTENFDRLNKRMFVFYSGNDIKIGNNVIMNANAVGWDILRGDRYEPVTLFWVKEGFPFPLKATIHQFPSNANYENQYELELLAVSPTIEQLPEPDTLSSPFEGFTQVCSTEYRMADSTIDLGKTPDSSAAIFGIAINADTGKIYASHSGNGTVAVIDAESGSIIKVVEIEDGRNSLDGIAVNSQTNKIYVASSYGNKLRVIDGTTDTVINSVQVGLYPVGVAIDSITNRVYVASTGANTVSIIDGANDTLISTVNIPSSPRFLTVNSLDHRIYVSKVDDATIAVIDGLKNGELERTLVLRDPPTGGSGEIVVNPITNRVYVGSSGVTVVNGTSGTVMHRISLNPYSTAYHLSVDPLTNEVFAGVFSASPGVVAVIDGNSDTVKYMVEVGDHATRLEGNGYTGKLYVVKGYDGQILILTKTNDCQFHRD
jgi:YVTN family beta-propeller protein